MVDDESFFKLITGKTWAEATKTPSLEDIDKLQFLELSSKHPVRVLGTGNETVYLQEEEREANMHIIGAPSEGKSKFLEHFIREDIERGIGLTLLDSSALNSSLESGEEVCNCGHTELNHWWNGGGNPDYGGSDACHQCKCKGYSVTEPSEEKVCDNCMAHYTTKEHTCPPWMADLKAKTKEIFTIESSPRIDYCSNCDSEHAYDCPKDEPLEARIEREFKKALSIYEQYPSEIHSGVSPVEYLISVVLKLIKEAKAETTEGIKQRVGFLRQALNEDRITDTNKLVNNKYIEHWLDLNQQDK